MLKTINLYIFITFISSMLFLSCETVTESPDGFDLGHEYYPISVGNEWVYEVDSFLYSNEGTLKDTSHWFIKETVIDTHTVFSDHEESYILERSRSKDLTSKWEVTDIWTINKSKTEIKKVEENLTFIKLVFPAKVGKNWDGNAYLDEDEKTVVYGEPLEIYGEWSYRIEDKLKTLVVGDITYSDVLKVREINEKDRLLEYRTSYAYYAKGLGLVQSDRSMLFDDTSTGTDWLIKADKGFIVQTKLVAYELK